jgi:ABC-type bacteriocin/lantibiotic exporter with double-glycine peptidase domain
MTGALSLMERILDTDSESSKQPAGRLRSTHMTLLSSVCSRLTIIPQESAIFSGTIRSNLDPECVKDDTEVWTALESRTPEIVLGETLDGQLDANVDEGGSNLSAGQCQLVSLARALLRDSPVLIALPEKRLLLCPSP